MALNSARNGLCALAAAAALALVSPASVFAQAGDYPNKPIRIIVSFSAGGTTDVVARQVALRLTQHLKQPVVVENKPGAGGTLGTDFVAHQPADGYTLLMTSSGPVSISPSLSKKLATNPLTEIIPVIAVVDVPNVLVVYPGLPAKSLADFVTYAKANSGKLNYASTGVGTVAHLSGAFFCERVGIDASHVPYKGADAVTDLMTGRTHFMFATLPSVIGNIQAGKLRPLASVSEKRSSALPDVPTMAEAGIDRMETGAWFGLFAPRGTPAAIVQKLNAVMNEILKEKEVREAFEKLGADPMGGTPQDFARKVMADYESWKPIVQRSGAAAD